jgi:beta-glucosidase
MRHLSAANSPISFMIPPPSSRLLLLLGSLALFASSLNASNIPQAEIPARVEVLMSQMSTEEKIFQLLAYQPNGLARLGIPSLESGEVLHGVVSDGATSFPQAIALGSTWDPALIERMTTVIGAEARAVGLGEAFSPMLGLARDPRWGRVEESYGEDPYLVSEIGVAFINGLQGEGADRFGPNHIIATAKHFVGDGEPFAGLNGEDPEFSDRTLREVYFPPFEAAVKRAHVGAIMPAHHSINGLPCHANGWLLTHLLRQEWGFNGFTVSDAGDIPKLADGHKWARDGQAAAIASISAGVDMELSSNLYRETLARSIQEGKLAPEILDRAVRRVLTAKLQLLGLGQAGVDAQPAVDGVKKEVMSGSPGEDVFAKLIAQGRFTTPASARRADWQTVLNDPSHDALALEVAQKAIVLLKNQNGLLPLDRTKVKRILVAGPLAIQVNLGGYSTGHPKFYVNVVDGLKKLLGPDTEVNYAQGCKLGDQSEDLIPAAFSQAQNSDVVIAVVGHSRDQVGENLDRDDISLIGGQLKMVQALQGAGKPVIVIFQNGAPISEPWIADHIPAVVESWYLGQATGTAVAQMLFGDINPGGKLSVSIARNLGQIPCYYSHPKFHGLQAVYNSQVKNLYPFGHGLSYTTFAYSNPVVQPAPGGGSMVSCTIQNTGQRPGDEVAQLYLRQDFTRLKRPIRLLKGFHRITLAPGESKTVSWPLGFEQAKYWMGNQWASDAGDITCLIGSSSEDLRAGVVWHYDGH